MNKEIIAKLMGEIWLWKQARNSLRTGKEAQFEGEELKLSDVIAILKAG